MISETETLKLLLEKLSTFKNVWERKITEDWEGNSPGLSLDTAIFSHYIRDLIAKNDIADRNRIKLAFELAEILMVEGNSKVKDAIATCFLENLINAVSWGRIQASSFVYLLGEESKKYCKAWDGFTGIKTNGLD